MQAIVAAEPLDQAFKKLAAVTEPVKDKPKLQITFETNKVRLCRANKEHTLSFSIPAEVKDPSPTPIVVDWSRFASIVKTGLMEDEKISIIFDPTKGSVHFKQSKAVSLKIPSITKPLSYNNYVCPADDSLILDGAATTLFFSSVEIASTFCKDKVVGPGKFPGVVVYPGHVTTVQHEGAIRVDGIQTKRAFSIPLTAVYTLSALGKSISNVRIAVSEQNASTSNIISGVSISGVIGEAVWELKFHKNTPSQTYGGYNLSQDKWPDVSKTNFVVDRETLNNFTGMATSVQGKLEPWIFATKIDGSGMAISTSELGGAVHSEIQVPFLKLFDGQIELPLKFKRVDMKAILSVLTTDSVEVSMRPEHGFMAVKAPGCLCLITVCAS